MADEEYPLAVEPELEEGIRAAADRINEQYAYLIDHYGNVSAKQVLSMLLLMEETKLVGLQKENAGEVSDIIREIESLNAELDEYLLSR